MNAHTKNAAAGTIVEWLGSTFRILMTPAETDGQIGMFEARLKPSFGPPRHIHRREDESVFIVEGEMLFWLDGRMFERKAGDVVFLPRGKEHTFKVTGATTAHVVTTVTPGGFESFFAAVARRGLTVPEHLAELAAVAASYDSEFTGPPLR